MFYNMDVKHAIWWLKFILNGSNMHGHSQLLLTRCVGCPPLTLGCSGLSPGSEFTFCWLAFRIYTVLIQVFEFLQTYGKPGLRFRLLAFSWQRLGSCCGPLGDDSRNGRSFSFSTSVNQAKWIKIQFRKKRKVGIILSPCN